MNDTKTNGCAARAAARPATKAEVVTPGVDIQEAPDGLVLSLDMPGVAADAVEIHFERGELAVKADRAPRGARGQALLREFGGAGTYYRAFLISQEVDATRISAALDKGVLTIQLPRAEAAQPRRIAVKA